MGWWNVQEYGHCECTQSSVQKIHTLVAHIGGVGGVAGGLGGSEIASSSSLRCGACCGAAGGRAGDGRCIPDRCVGLDLGWA